MSRRFVLVAAVAVALAACDTTEPRVPTSIQVDQQTVNLQVGESATVQAFVLDQHGRAYDVAPEGFQITWSSTQSGVASVNQGQITAVGSGNATIRASAGNLQPAEVAVTVEAPTVQAQIGFNYSGHRSGSFSVQSTFRTDNIPWNGDFAFTLFDSDWNDQDIMAQRRRTDGRFDFIWFWVDGQVTTTGTRPADAGIFMIGYDASTDQAEAVYFVASGSVNFTSASATRLGGTFSLGMVEEDTGASLSISGGTFNLPVLSERDVYGDPASFDGAARQADVPELLIQLRRQLQPLR